MMLGYRLRSCALGFFMIQALRADKYGAVARWARPCGPYITTFITFMKPSGQHDGDKYPAVARRAWPSGPSISG